MSDWELTATTVYCDSVDDEVTLIVYGDETVKCTGRQKYEKPEKTVRNLMKKRGNSKGKLIKCQGDDCAIVKQYRDKMLGEK